MGITDWDVWMKEHHIYIPTAKEVEEVKRRNLVKVHAMAKALEDNKAALEAYKKKVESSR